MHWDLHEWIYIYIYIYIAKLATLVESDPKAPFSIATTPRFRGGHNYQDCSHFTLDPHLIMLCVKQGGIKYHFLSLCTLYSLDQLLTLYIYIYIK